MQQESLFGYLAERFSAHPENLATEALNYILWRSPVAKAAFVRLVSESGFETPTDLLFQTQVAGTDRVIPDLVGKDAEGRTAIMVEAKFWAGLTDNQPVAYLQRFSAGDSCVLLFIAPGLRFGTLWPELLRRCQEAGLKLVGQRELGNEFRVADVLNGPTLAILSWRTLLAYILRAVETAGQTETASDILQLQGLCEKMDGHAFLPLRSEELSANLGKRITQFCSLIDDVTNHFLSVGIGSVKGLKATSKVGVYGRYILLSDYGCFIHFNASLWATLRSTPFWLRVKDKGWKTSSYIKDALLKLELEEPARLLFDGEFYQVPLYAPVGAERQQVLMSLINQVQEVVDLFVAHEPKEEPKL